ncbi:MAG: 50S ribosome-binding GTPase [Deltaproteobacteria bacterium]|nr:50S ribosome-binding GTPase [Deltaproteobacteria bacterium]
MPANLTPPYIEAEKRYREAKTPTEKLAALEEMLTILPKHKGTDKLRADLTKRISKLKLETKKKTGGKKQAEYVVEKQGGGQIVLVGPPNSGKSTILFGLTNAVAEIADYPFTTRTPLPGMMPYRDIYIQLVDLPPVSREFVPSWLFDAIRRADSVLLVVDLYADPLEQLNETLGMLKEHRIALTGQKVNRELDQKAITGLIAANKMDIPQAAAVLDIFRELQETDLDIFPISAMTGQGLEALKDHLVEGLDIFRVYTKKPGKKPELDSPYIMKKGAATILDLAYTIHRELGENFKYARLWRGNEFQGQMIQRDFTLQDEDIVELHT